MPRKRKSALPKVVGWSPQPSVRRSSSSSVSSSKSTSPYQSVPSQTKGPTQGNSPAEINAIQPGMWVEHAKFGRGKVQSVEGSGDSRKAIVFFSNIGQKQLMLKFAKLTICE